MLKEVKEFAIKGNAVDLAVGVIIGAAFGGIVTSLVKDILMPPIGLLTGGLDFSNKFLVLKCRHRPRRQFRHSVLGEQPNERGVALVMVGVDSETGRQHGVLAGQRRSRRHHPRHNQSQEKFRHASPV